MNNTPQPATTCGAPSRRIINKIPLDFNKLRCAGLDRILAEELSKQNTKGKTLINIAASTTKEDQELYLPKSLTTPTQDQQQQPMTHLKDSDVPPIRIQEYCRICMDNSKQLTNIMSEPDQDHELSLFEMLNDVMDEAYRIERDGEDSMPQHICNNCAAATRNAYALRRQYEESYRYFRQQLTKMRQIPEPDAAAKRAQGGEFILNIKEEPASEPDYIISDDEETYAGDVPIKEEQQQHQTDETNIKELSHMEMASNTKGFNLRLLLIRKREQLESQEDLYEVDRTNKGPLQCGLCFSRCGLTNWHTHLGEHYGVGWLHGQKPPSLTRGGIIAQMSGYLKEDRDNRLTCRLCHRQFGSGLGMMQHLEGCGEEFQRFQCIHCGRSYTKLSLIAHQRCCMKKYLAQAADKEKLPKRKPKLASKITWLMDGSSIKKKSIDRSPFNLRLLLIRKREQLTTTEEVREADDGTGPLQCGLCLARCGKSTWKMHIAEHYGVGWLKNDKDDKPHTITRSGVINMMQTYLKENQGSRLICRLCGREFASGLGMLLHLEGCGEQAQRLACKYCNRSYTRLSLITHLRSCGHRYQPQPQPQLLPPSSANVELKTERKPRTKPNLDQSQIKKSSAKAPFNLRLLLIRKREDLDSQVVIPQQVQTDGQLQCGLCSEGIIKEDWRNHLSTHYGVGWLSGQEPRTITRHTIIGQMNSYLKKNPGKRLTCRLCDRQLSSGLGMLLHLEGCGMKKYRMKCKYCAGSFTRLSLLQHIRLCERQFEKEHQLDLESQTDIDDSGVEGEGEGSVELSKFKRKRSKAIHNSTKWTKSLYTRYQLLNDKVVSKWTQFTQANYAKEPLYADCLPSYVKLSWTETHELLNSSRQTKSMRFAYDKVRDESDWRELKPLEAINTKNEYITYLGAPIRQLEWVPLPPNVNEEYLLCSLRSKMHGYTRKVDANAKDKALMVLLKCALDTESRATDEWPLQMKLHYGIRVQKGPVFSFAFMPSGGYVESSNRLGLLAIATASSEIHIYALPLQLTAEETIQAGQDSIIELNSLMTLSLDVKSSVQDQCTKICWSEAHGHSFLVSGYASGNVAFWDIGDVEGINCFKRHNQNSFVPLHYFYFGERNIQFLELHYDTNGSRWLAVGTSLRKLRIYDILNRSQPLSLVGDAELKNLFKGCISWPAIWESIAIGDTSVFQINFTRVVVLSPCGILFNNKTIDYVLDSARDMHFNCQENILIVVTANGDLAFINPRELNMDPRAHKLTHNVRAVSYTELAKLNDDSSKENNVAISADDFQRDYGVIIKPLIAITKAKKDDYLNHQRRPSSFELMTMTPFNSVRCNLNSSARSWVAVGAEHGMLRIVNFRRNDYFT